MDVHSASARPPSPKTDPCAPCGAGTWFWACTWRRRQYCRDVWPADSLERRPRGGPVRKQVVKSAPRGAFRSCLVSSIWRAFRQGDKSGRLNPEAQSTAWGRPALEDQAFELRSSCRIVPKDASQIRSAHRRPHLAHPARHHAVMRRAYHHPAAPRLQMHFERRRDLRRHPFLELQPPREDIDQARQL